MVTKVGGTVVARDGVIKWGALASIFVGSWGLAWVHGGVSLINGFREFHSDALGGVSGFLTSAITTLFGGFSGAIYAAWRAWGTFATSNLGVFAYAATVLVVVFSLWAAHRGISEWGKW